MLFEDIRQSSRRNLFLIPLALLNVSRVLAAEIEEIEVIGVTPAQGSGLPESMIPYNVQSAGAGDMEKSQSLDLTDFLNRNIASVSINEAQNNPLQPDLQYRGFTASPLLGLAQGIAVHQNGVRINEPLGDTVNWDLLPESAIRSINLIGGSNPLFGLNTLGGALSIEMKNGFSTQGHNIKIYGGSSGRIVTSIESGASNGSLAYYANLHYFDEDGWREQSPSDSLNFYGSLGWQGKTTELNLNLQYGKSGLVGNGPLPLELLLQDRSTIFTAPDITDNNLLMISTDLNYELADHITFTGDGFYRQITTDSFNGDTSDFIECRLTNGIFLLDEIEEDLLENLGLDNEQICDDNLLNATDPGNLETNLNSLLLPGSGEFNINDLTGELSGTGDIEDAAANNISNRKQKSYGADLQLTFTNDIFNRNNQLIAGTSYFRGVSGFSAKLELADLNSVTRSTAGLGTGTFVDEAATNIMTTTETVSLYITDTIELGNRLVLTLSGRINDTTIDLRDLSGIRPELNGNHDFFRFNPAVGLTYQVGDNLNIYSGYSESSRTPTPIELACNDSIFEQAVANALAAGEDPDDIEFECRLPNAFLADPPLQQVVARSFELGARGKVRGIEYQLGFFHTGNENDIIFQTTGRATGLFANVDKTKRIGLESSFNGSWNNINWYFNYSLIKATFEDDFSVLSPNHPFADEDGETRVVRGDSIPGIPEDQLKLGADYVKSDAYSIGMELLYYSGQVLRGDESNQLVPLAGYVLVNLRSRYQLNDQVEVFARINNIFNSRYETFGLLGEDPGEVEVPAFSSFSDPRFLGPGAPRSAFAGIKISFN